MKINLVGSIEGNSGYAHHTRNLATALEKLGHDVAIETFIINPEWKKTTPPEITRMISKDHSQEQVQVIIMPPPQAYTKSGDRNKIFQYAIFEGTQVPTGWKLALNEPFITRVIAPSEHTKKACLNGGVKTPIDVVPHGVNTKVFNPQAKPIFEDKDSFTFVWCKGWALGEKDRSALDVFLRAFSEEFKEEEKVRALVKINAAYAQKNYALEIQKLNLNKNARNKILINTAFLPEQEMAGIYTSGNVFVSVSRGDAFDLPCLEAMACGLPVIYSTHNGHEDYAKGWPLEKGRLIKPGDPNPLYEECQWWETDQKELQEVMRKAYDGQLDYKQTDIVLVASHYTWKKSAENLLESIKKAEE